MTLKELNDNYVYQGDKHLDSWQEMKPNKDGKYIGDCEDYCITLKKNIYEFKDWEYWYCKLNGVGHCVLCKNGDIIDCNIKHVVTLEQYYKMYTVSELRKYNIIVVMSKVVTGNILKLLGVLKSYMMGYNNKW